MFVVRIDGGDAREFRAFRRVREARSYVREAQLAAYGESDTLIFDVADTDDAEIAVIAVRDGLGVPVPDMEPDAAVMLASMGLGTGLRI
ncbi:hypothetical protein [Aureimonas sp. AU12]|jgi:hypothetical protein|uniref:hypothetical protein n=1 Tax=Aureimonas sp. AU12 TaxID=1638161 RepID=UPI00078412B9|nr:hypothetical protein [Aureimonas sp. AU12]